MDNERDIFQGYTAGDLVEIANEVMGYLLDHENKSCEQFARDILPAVVRLLRDSGWTVTPPEAASEERRP
jgi:hypothetical protein